MVLLYWIHYPYQFVPLLYLDFYSNQCKLNTFAISGHNNV